MGSVTPQEKASITILIIDISPYLNNNPAQKLHVISSFRSACENEGFLQIIGHGIGPSLITNFLTTIAQFFALPHEDKMKVSFKNPPCDRGYEHLGGQKLDELDENATPDQKEAFSVRRDRPAGGKFLQGVNQWPERPQAFRMVMEEFYEVAAGLSGVCFRIMALSLGLDEEYFDEFASDPDGVCLARAHHYPPTPVDTSGHTRGIGAHTDYGAMTLLIQDDVGGLEVLHKKTGTWHHVEPVPGAIIVNIGDLMQRWTNDRYKSTMHRVVSPKHGKDRYSCAYFNEGMLDAVVECIPSCLKEGEKPLYGPLKVEDHLINRYTQSYSAGGTELNV